MHILVTGGAGFLGARLIQALLAHDHGATIVSLDRVVCPIEDARLISWVGDLRDAGIQAEIPDTRFDAIYHLAAVVSGEAERDFDLGMAVNLDATRTLLEICRAQSHTPRLVFASSVAVFASDMPAPLDRYSAAQPQSSYGTAKAIGELLINDYSRRGFIDGVVCRLPTISVRPGRPNQATTSFASAIIREPLNGEPASCPVDPDLAMWLSSPQTVVANLVHALTLHGDAIGALRTLNLPGITTRVADMVSALERSAGAEAVARIEYARDPAIEAIVASFPARFDTRREAALGFDQDRDFDAVVAAYREETGIPAHAPGD
ncbi:MAG: NAD-dependent epimerase [Xanthomonadales bacterium]|nr:NAD-dependent epimerase [Xanthomonadales bacterium]